MATTFQWVAPETLASALTTEMDANANSTSDTTGFSTLSAEINNESGLYQYIELELRLAAQASARSAGGWVGVMIAAAVDGATPTYPADSNAAYVVQLASFTFDAATTARILTRTMLPIPPCKFKLYTWNKTGQAFAANTNILKYRRHNEQGI